MNFLALVVGWAFLISCLLGMVVPGMNFHVILGGDEFAKTAHQRHIEEIQNRLDRKEDHEKDN